MSTFPVATVWAWRTMQGGAGLSGHRLLKVRYHVCAARLDSGKSSSGRGISLTSGPDFRAGPLPRLLPGQLLPPTNLTGHRGKP